MQVTDVDFLQRHIVAAGCDFSSLHIRILRSLFLVGAKRLVRPSLVAKDICSAPETCSPAKVFFGFHDTVNEILVEIRKDPCNVYS